MSWFSEGYEAVEKRDKEIKESMRTFIPNFFVKENDENVYISFLIDEPITFYEHYVPSLKRYFTCLDGGDTTKGNCPLCAMGNKPSFRGAYLIVDHRKEKWTDKDGKEHEQQHTIKVAKWGIRVLKQLHKQHIKLKQGSPVQKPIEGGITGVPFEVIRSGEGTDTAYTFTPLQPNPEMFPKDLSKLPEKDGRRLTPRETVIEAVKPLTRERLLDIINNRSGSSATAEPVNPFASPITSFYSDDDSDDVIEF